MGKDLTEEPVRQARPLEIGAFNDDPAAKAASAFLKGATVAEPLPPPTPAAEEKKREQAPTVNAPTAPRPPVVAAAPAYTPAQPPARVPSSEISVDARSWPNKTIGLSATAMGFLTRFKRRHRVAFASVIQLALDRLFASSSDEEIASTLRAVGRGLRSSSESVRAAKTGVRLAPATVGRLESLRDDHRIAEGNVGSHALDHLIATMTEDEIAAELRERGRATLRRQAPSP